MNTLHFSSKKQENYTLASLEFAKNIGLISDSSLKAVISRCQAENEKRKTALEKGETVFGLTHFTAQMYLDYELTRFRLDFVSEKEEIKKHYTYKTITRKDKRNFYKSNKDLFTRYAGDKFCFYEVAMIIEKKLREEEFENEIQNILRKLS